MRINTNIASLQAQNQLQKTTRALQRSLERLSSGKRINSARDDASGLAIANRLDSQVRGMARAALNINESFNFLQAADGILETQTELIQRMRELALQSANGTLSVNDRVNLNSELQSLIAEFQRVTDQAQFNGTKILDGSFGTKTIQVGTQKSETIDFSLPSLNTAGIYSSSSTRYTGQGTFTLSSTPSLAAAPTSPGVTKLFDVNGDGKLDALTLDTTENTISIFLGNGSGGFAARVTTAVVAGTTNFDVGDISGDGKADILTMNSSSTQMRLLTNNGSQSFSSSTITASVTIKDVQLKDITGDGKLDIVAAGYSGGTSTYVSAFLGTGSGTFGSEQLTTITGVRNAVGGAMFDVGDVNGDGKLDVVLGYNNSSYYPVLRILAGSGAGTFSAIGTIVLASTGNTVTGSSIDQIHLADVNGDGKADIITDYSFSYTNGVIGTSIQGSVSYLGAGSGSFGSGVATGNYWGGAHYDLADVTGDGVLDRVVSGYNWQTDSTETFIEKGNGNGTFQAAVGMGTASDTYSTVGDLNGDGISDIVGLHGGQIGESSYLLALLQDTSKTAVSTNIDISTQAGAQTSLSVLASALTTLNSARASIGASQSRLEYSLSNAMITRENLSAAYSQIMDADIASESSELVKNQILQQAQIAVTGQANASLQIVLELLRPLA